MRHRYVSLDGGIGNLLFQYAAAKSIAANSVVDVVLAEFQAGLLQRLETYVGPVEFKVVNRWSAIALGSIAPPSLGRFGKLVNITGRSIVDGLFRLDAGSNGEMDSDRVNRSLFLQGYFQHSSWFASPLPGLLERLAMRRPSEIPNRLDGVVGVHVRRGDYVGAGWALPFSYYSSALRIASSRGYRKVFVASDDPMVGDLLRSSLESDGWEIIRSDDYRDASAFTDFHLLAGSDALILSNSTFSWWAARLNEHLAGSGVGPRFAPAHWIDGGDHLLDEHWITVD